MSKGGTHGATGPAIIVSSNQWDQPPLVPPVEEEGQQVHVGKVGERKGMREQEGEERQLGSKPGGEEKGKCHSGGAGWGGSGEKGGEHTKDPGEPVW